MKQSPIDLDENMYAWVHAPIEYRNYFLKDDNQGTGKHRNKVIKYKTLKVSVCYRTLDGQIDYTLIFQNFADGIR